MTPVQAQALPHLLSGNDLIAQAKTGSGKTAAFAIGLLNKLDAQMYSTQALVLCPTRELADQVAKEVRKLARALGNIKVLTLCGGVPVRSQVSSLAFGADIVVGTPGRIQDHLKRETLKLTDVKTLVLDEADRMLDMGFQQAIADINQQTPSDKQTLLFSATYSGKVKAIAKKMMQDPKVIKVASLHDSSTIRQHFFELQHDKLRLDALKRILLAFTPESAVGFCNTKRDAQDVTDSLIDAGFSALDLTGDLEQRDRDQTLIQFANKSISILVATDVAARGLDMDKLDMVINYHLAHDPESHIHRIGRTGRAGQTGIAISFCDAGERALLKDIEAFIQMPVRLDKDHPFHLEIQDKKPMFSAKHRKGNSFRKGGRGKAGSNFFKASKKSDGGKTKSPFVKRRQVKSGAGKVKGPNTGGQPLMRKTG